jgi:hypothetical protein
MLALENRIANKPACTDMGYPPEQDAYHGWPYQNITHRLRTILDRSNNPYADRQNVPQSNVYAPNANTNTTTPIQLLPPLFPQLQLHKHTTNIDTAHFNPHIQRTKATPSPTKTTKDKQQQRKKPHHSHPSSSSSTSGSSTGSTSTSSTDIEELQNRIDQLRHKQKNTKDEHKMRQPKQSQQPRQRETNITERLAGYYHGPQTSQRMAEPERTSWVAPYQQNVQTTDKRHQSKHHRHNHASSSNDDRQRPTQQQADPSPPPRHKHYRK